MAPKFGGFDIIEVGPKVEASGVANMPEEQTPSSQETSETAGHKPSLNFREFLKSKAKETGVEDRHRRRTEWIGAINRLLDQIRCWLREFDPDEVLDIEPYEVSRTERKLGSYDAPALKIRLGAAEVDVLPMGRDVPFMAIRGASGDPTEFAGRIDVTDGYRKYNLYREVREDKDLWQIINNRNKLTYLDSNSFAELLQDLLS
jgi:hypothetical protein